MTLRNKKSVVILIDGTGNQPYSVDDSNISNITYIARALKFSSSKASQLIFYHRGVGSEPDASAVQKSEQQMTGSTIDNDIIDCYRFIMHNYSFGDGDDPEPDDLYLIGFSRGAASTVSLAGMLHKVGIIAKHRIVKKDIRSAYGHYVKSNESVTPEEHKQHEEELQGFKDEKGCKEVKIRFVGLFDTVFALKYGDAHTKVVPPNVQYVAHAVSIDETRQPFPVQKQDEYKGEGELREVWFPGDHSDIGGGHARHDTHMSHYVCRWMIEQAKLTGLEFEQPYIDNHLGYDLENPAKRLHFEAPPSVIWKLVPKGPRDIPDSAKFDDLVYYKTYLGCLKRNQNVKIPDDAVRDKSQFPKDFLKRGKRIGLNDSTNELNT